MHNILWNIGVHFRQLIATILEEKGHFGICQRLCIHKIYL